MLAPDEILYLSDVHVHTKIQHLENRSSYLSRFVFKYQHEINDSEKCVLKQEHKEEEKNTSQVASDEDGDFNLDSRVCNNSVPPTVCRQYAEHEIDSSHEVITLEHMMQTSLNDVGYQVWPGALLMCDYLLHERERLKTKVALDLGAGTGLTSLVAALCCSKVICTDYCSEILEMAQRNWTRNQDFLPFTTKPDDMKFMILNWAENGLSCENENSNSELLNSDNQLFLSATLLLAAEAVYDDELTDACFSTIYHLLKKPPEKEVLMAVEKRIVYSLVSHTVCSPAYEHFIENLDDLSSIDEGNVRFACHQIPTHDLPQYFVETRTKELELWKISSKFISDHNDIPAGS